MRFAEAADAGRSIAAPARDGHAAASSRRCSQPDAAVVNTALRPKNTSAGGCLAPQLSQKLSMRFHENDPCRLATWSAACGSIQHERIVMVSDFLSLMMAYDLLRMVLVHGLTLPGAGNVVTSPGPARDRRCAEGWHLPIASDDPNRILGHWVG